MSGVSVEALRSGLSLLGPVLIGISILNGRDHLALFALFVLTITFLDAVLPAAHGIMSRCARPSRLAALLPHVHLPMHLLLLLCALQLWCEPNMQLYDRVGMVVGFGVYGCAFGINVAHELIHRRSRLSRACGGLTLALVCYGSFKVEHIYGHHVHVATPEDPSSSPRGRGFWAHLPRAVVGNFRAALRINALETVGWAAVSGALAAGIFGAWGAQGVAFFFLQSAVAVLAMELTNYVEHYGLARCRLPNGRYAPVGPSHSWSTPAHLSNALFFNVQRHAHHHARPGVTYERLRHLAGSPTLPTGYPAMMMLAMVPAAWHMVIDTRIPKA